jgi:hypothetical protein
MAPATAELVAKLQRSNPSAMPLKERAGAPNHRELFTPSKPQRHKNAK